MQHIHAERYKLVNAKQQIKLKGRITDYYRKLVQLDFRDIFFYNIGIQIISKIYPGLWIIQTPPNRASLLLQLIASWQTNGPVCQDIMIFVLCWNRKLVFHTAFQSNFVIFQYKQRTSRATKVSMLHCSHLHLRQSKARLRRKVTVSLFILYTVI